MFHILIGLIRKFCRLWQGLETTPEPGHPVSANQLPDPVQHELPALLAAGAGLWPGAEQEGSGPAGPPVLVCSPVATATPRGMRSFVFQNGKAHD